MRYLIDLPLLTSEPDWNGCYGVGGSITGPRSGPDQGGEVIGQSASCEVDPDWNGHYGVGDSITGPRSVPDQGGDLIGQSQLCWLLSWCQRGLKPLAVRKA